MIPWFKHGETSTTTSSDWRSPSRLACQNVIRESLGSVRTHDDSNNHHQRVLREDYGDKLDRIFDIVSSTNERLARVEADIGEVSQTSP